MPKFSFNFRRTEYWSGTIEAESREEAWDEVYDNYRQLGTLNDYDNDFELTEETNGGD